MARRAPDPVYMLRGSDSPITALNFVQSANHETVLASGNLNGQVQLWDLKSYRCVQSLALEEGKSVLWIEEIPVSGDIITQSRAGKVCVWSRTDGSFIKSGENETLIKIIWINSRNNYLTVAKSFPQYAF